MAGDAARGKELYDAAVGALPPPPPVRRVAKLELHKPHAGVRNDAERTRCARTEALRALRARVSSARARCYAARSPAAASARQPCRPWRPAQRLYCLYRPWRPSSQRPRPRQALSPSQRACSWPLPSAPSSSASAASAATALPRRLRVRRSCQRGRSPLSQLRRTTAARVARTNGRVVRSVREEHLAHGAVVARHGEEAAALIEGSHHALEARALHVTTDRVLQRWPVRHVRPVRVARAGAAAAAGAPWVACSAGRREAALAARVAPACAGHSRPELPNQRQTRVTLRGGHVLGLGRDARRELPKLLSCLEPR